MAAAAAVLANGKLPNAPATLGGFASEVKSDLIRGKLSMTEIPLNVTVV